MAEEVLHAEAEVGAETGRAGEQIDMELGEDEYEVQGEVIKMIHGELPAVRWTCAGCGEDACTIFYEPESDARTVECESCHASNLVHRQSAE